MRRVEVQGQGQGHLPAQVELQTRDGFGIADIVVELQQQDATHERWRQTRSALVRAIHLGQIIIREQLLDHGPQARLARVGRHALRSGLSFKQAVLWWTASDHCSGSKQKGFSYEEHRSHRCDSANGPTSSGFFSTLLANTRSTATPRPQLCLRRMT